MYKKSRKKRLLIRDEKNPTNVQASTEKQTETVLFKIKSLTPKI